MNMASEPKRISGRTGGVSGKLSPDALIEKLTTSLDSLVHGVDAQGKCYIQACIGLLDGLRDGTVLSLTKDHIDTIAATAKALSDAVANRTLAGNITDRANYETALDIMNNVLPQLCSYYGQPVRGKQSSAVARLEDKSGVRR